MTRLPHDEALSLEMSILQALLQRNRCSHGRTLYYKRLSMALRALQRLLEKDQALETRLTRLQEQQQTKQTRKRQEEWTLLELEQGNPDEVALLEQAWSDWQMSLTVNLSQVVSRIQHAAEALWVEVARGFFLPWCTVALGALGRLRVLLQTQGRAVRAAALNAQCLKVAPRGHFPLDAKALAVFDEPCSGEQRNRTSVEREMWTSLGRMPPPTAENRVESSLPLLPCDDDDDDDKETPPTAKRVATAAALPIDDDVGETVEWKNTVPASNNERGMREEPDRNAQVLAGFQTKERKSLAQKRKVDPKEETTGIKKKKKKTKKKKKKKDVFDEIFGD